MQLSKNPGAANSNNFGLGLIGTSEGNLVEKNKIGGNVNGLFISSPRRNEIRRNIIAGNPPVQVSQTFGKSIGADIQELSPAGTHTFEGNYCLTYAGKTDPAPCPDISGRNDHDGDDGDNEENHHGHNDRHESGMAARRAITPFQVAVKHANVRPNRLAFPQARLINAVFHLSGRAIPKTAGSAEPTRPVIPIPSP